MFHYTYSISYTDQPNIYYGVRSTHKPPEQDTGYWGSPKTFKVWMDAHKATRVKTILAAYSTREEAELAEDELIERQWAIAKPLSLNSSIRGSKFNRLGSKNNQKQIETTILVRAKKFLLISPEGVVFEGTNLRQFCKSKGLHNGNCVDVIQFNKLHYEGWTASSHTHKIYLEAYQNRGISWHSQSNSWQLRWGSKHNRKIEMYEDKIDAIAKRDILSSQGVVWRVNQFNWKSLIPQSCIVA